MEDIKSPEAEPSFTYSVQEIAEEVFIREGDPPEVKDRKRSEGFYVEDTETNFDYQLKEHGVAALITNAWLNDASNFHSLIKLLTKYNSILDEDLNDMSGKDKNIRLKLIRSSLCQGAQAEISDYVNYLDQRKIFGEKLSRVRKTNSQPSPDEAQVRMKGLEAFRQKVLAKNS